MKPDQAKAALEQAREVLRIEADGILALVDKVDERFARLLDAVLDSPGRVILTGLGKSGIVARKIVATLNSTGTQAVYLHPVEAMHGDLGLVGPEDVVIAISNSGETDEVNLILPAIKRLGAMIAAFTGDPDSTLARQADLVIDVGVPREACPLGLAPTSSTTAALAMGDALAVALINHTEFTPEDFKARHPGGSLGERLQFSVSEIMVTGPKVPTIGPAATLEEVVRVVDEGDLGTALVVEDQGRLQGIITDGDLRRALRRGRDVHDLAARDLMTAQPATVGPDLRAAQALTLMESKGITALPVVDSRGRILGIVHLHDVLGRQEFHVQVS
ncbi:MAG: KpsF/GutQ family sugar-phosphate isomerase [Proteobacteria bacterium]|nr:KpsF/GutQ family sugar-phosphate isomerase [Pseudomonadota bacterium]MBU1742082.1 KpsF/GutQ family sugar-phosphate isomerase [Pseudomonadota bacterium]